MYHKRFTLSLKVLGIVFLYLATLSGCKKPDVSETPEPGFLQFPDGKELVFDESGGSKSLSLRTNISALRVAFGEAAPGWLSARVTPNALVCIAQQNDGDDARTAKLTLTGAGISENVNVTQTGRAPFIKTSAKEYAVDEYGGKIAIEVVTNRAFDVVIPQDADWLRLESIGKESPVIVTLSVSALTEGNRTAVVTLKGRDSNAGATFSVTQEAGTGYAPKSELTLPTDFKVVPTSGTASSFHEGEGIENAFDGLFDDNKLYHSAWDNSPGNYFPITLEFNFDGTKDLSYLIYYPRQNGANGRFKEIEVWGKGSALKDYTLLKSINLEGSVTPSKVVFEQTLLGAGSIKIVVKSGAGDRKGFASASEIEFYQNNPDKFDLLSVFTDTSASALKTGITEADIREIKVPVYQQIAYHLRKGDYPREFRIDTFKAFPNPDTERAYNRTGYALSLFDNPTGIVVKKDQDLLVLVGKTSGHKLGLWVVNYDVPGGDGVNGRKMLTLEEGANLLKMPQDGHLYLAYNTDDWQTAPEIKVHFANGLVQGYYDSQKHAPEKYLEILNNASASQYLDVLGKYAHLAFPVKDFRAAQPRDGLGLANLYDNLVKMEFDFLGLFKYDRPFHNRAFFSVHYNPDLYLYATGYHTAYSSGSIQSLLSVDGVKRESWGLAHELGHQLQTTPGVKWHGMTEVTNNIMSLYIQTEYGNTARIQAESNGVYATRYDKAYALFQIEDYAGDPSSFAYAGQLVPYLGRKNEIYSDVFEMLVPLWQIQLYFSKVKGNKDFYKDIYEQARKEYDSDMKKSDGQVQLDFVRKASISAGMDLTDFFDKWGFFRLMDQNVMDYSNKRIVISSADVSSAKSKIALLGLPPVTDKIEYICDGNWQYFKDKTPVTGSGSATVSGNVVIIPQNAYRGVVAYEFYLNGKLIGVANNPRIILPQTISLDGKQELFAVAYDGKKTAIPVAKN